MPRFLRCLVASLLLPCVIGCGGSKSTEPTLVQQAETAGRLPDPEMRARTLIEISVKQREMKDIAGAGTTIEGALRAATEIKDPAVKADVLVQTAKELLASGGSKLQANAAIDAAQIAVARIQDRQAKIAATIDLAQATHRMSETATAKTLLGTAGALLDGVTEPSAKVPLTAAYAAGRFSVGDRDEGNKMLQSAAEQAAAISDVRARVRALAEGAATVYRAAYPTEGRKLVDAAVADARKIEDPLGRAYALAEIVEAMNPYRAQLPVAELLAEASNAAREVKSLDQQTVLMKHLQTLVK